MSPKRMTATSGKVVQIMLAAGGSVNHSGGKYGSALQAASGDDYLGGISCSLASSALLFLVLVESTTAHLHYECHLCYLGNRPRCHERTVMRELLIVTDSTSSG